MVACQNKTSWRQWVVTHPHVIGVLGFVNKQDFDFGVKAVEGYVTGAGREPQSQDKDCELFDVFHGFQI